MPQKNDFTLTFILRQHTPLIHFQADQPGATLRATELKPKLDRFLIKYFKEKCISFEKWLNPKQTNALQYKIQISAEGVMEKWYFFGPLNKEKRKVLDSARINYVENSLYFAQEQNVFDVQNDKTTFNRNNLNNIKHYGIKYESITLKLLSFHSELLKLINKEALIHAFFLTHNFGTRNNKGFGSFTVSHPKTDLSIEELLKNAGIKVFYVTSLKTKSTRKIHEKIDSDYKFIKSGSNKPKYKKSLLFEYFCKKKIGWEKRAIKQHLEKHNKSKKDQERLLLYAERDSTTGISCGDDEKYIRVLLGLAEHYEFMMAKEKATEKDNNKKLVVTISPKDKSINRFPSPLTFKPTSDHLYILLSEIPEKILNTNFRFDFKLKEKVQGRWITRSTDIEELIIEPPKIEHNFLTDLLDDCSQLGYEKKEIK